MTDDDAKQWEDRNTRDKPIAFKSSTSNQASPIKCMSRTYYFHALTMDGIVPDETGIELEQAQLDFVRQEIVEAVLELTMGESEKDEGSTIIGFVVADDFGRTLLEIPVWEMMSHFQLLHGEPRGAA